jgi:hypothetical protein
VQLLSQANGAPFGVSDHDVLPVIVEQQRRFRLMESLETVKRNGADTDLARVWLI